MLRGSFRNRIPWGGQVIARSSEGTVKIKTPNGRVKLRTEGELRGQANLRNANLGRDNIGGSAQLNAADLREAVLVGARLEGAEYDARTHFPAGFRPEEDGRGLTGAAGQQA